MKKLLFVISSLEGSGGAERSLISRVNYLVENYNYDITIAVTSPSETAGTFYPLHSKVKLVNIPLDFSRTSLMSKLKTLFPGQHREEKPLLDFINQQGFDICTSFGSETFLYHEAGYENFIKIKENRFTYKKLFTDEKLSLRKKIWRNIRFRNAVEAQKKMNFVITLTEEDANFWRKYLKKVVVMPNFINLKDFTLSTVVNKEVIAVGRLEREKDFFSMIRAFRRVVNAYPDWYISVYGEGSLRNELQKLIDDLNLAQHVILKGSVKDIYHKYTGASMYMMTSHYEGFPNTMLEAMAHGLPIVAFESVGGVKVLIQDKDNGFLVKNRNIKELADSAIKLIEDSKLRNAMGRNSRLRAEEYDVESIMGQWHRFYQNAI